MIGIFQMQKRQCVACFNTIPQARVESVKNAIRCVRCQTNLEKTHDTRIKMNEVESNFSYQKPATSKAIKKKKRYPKII